jgi:hypothetical protein
MQAFPRHLTSACASTVPEVTVRGRIFRAGTVQAMLVLARLGRRPHAIADGAALRTQGVASCLLPALPVAVCARRCRRALVTPACPPEPELA